MKIRYLTRERYVVTSQFTAAAPGEQPGDHRRPAVCKRPGCGNPLPASTGGRGRTRQFCSTECARRYHNDARIPAPRSSPAGGDPVAVLESLVRQMAVAVRAAREQAADARKQIETLTAALEQAREELRAARDELDRRDDRPAPL